MILPPSSPEAAIKLLSFLNASPTPFHAVHNAALRLEKAGFQKIREQDDWETNLKEGGKYYFTRNQSALLAFTLPKSWRPGTGASIVATHVDSPNLRVRPISKRSGSGYLQVGVETYGGGIWHSWFDRDLSVAGRVIAVDHAGNYTSKLVKIDRPLLRIPTLAIHLDRTANESFKFNRETEFVPILSLVQSQLSANRDSETDMDEDVSTTASGGGFHVQKNHHPALLSALAQELSVNSESIHDFELALYDTQPSVLGGMDNEFVFSPRLDNLFSSFCAVEALAESVSSQSFLTEAGNVNCIALFNHEEIGSVSTSGAQSSLIPSLLQRLSPGSAAFSQSVARSFLISADMGHAIHPNYQSKHEENHAPRMNGGVVIKTNAQQRYASDAIGSFIIKQLIQKKGGKVQEYEVRNDMACGSTVGPMLSKIGLRTVDVGCAMLSMHSCRETAGVHDVKYYLDLFKSFFEDYVDVTRTLTLD